jgi:CheY-like chemotaxis protein
MGAAGHLNPQYSSIPVFQHSSSYDVKEKHVMAKKVLMIDDDPEFVEAISNLLDAKGYDVHTASNGKEGIEKAKAQNPDIILLDVMMTTKDEGFNVARGLHDNEQLKDTPIIMMTGIRREMNLPFGFEPDEAWLPVRKVLEKPVKPEVLLAAIAENIRR